MAGDTDLEIYRQLHAGQEKYTYFLLAAAASGIAAGAVLFVGWHILGIALRS